MSNTNYEGLYKSNENTGSCGLSLSHQNTDSKGLFYSHQNTDSKGLAYCNYLKNCKGMYKCSFCINQRFKGFMIFNKQYTEKEYDEIISKIDLDNLESLKKLDIWDDEASKIVEEITGKKIVDNKVKIICEGKEVFISRESAKALNLIN